MANDEVAAGEAITAVKANGLTIGTTAPTTLSDGIVWIDTSMDPPTVKVYDNSASQWRNLASINVGTSNPTSPTRGMARIETSAGQTARLYTYDDEYSSGGWFPHALAPMYRYNSGTKTFSGSSIEVTDSGLSIRVKANIIYRATVRVQCNAGGTGRGDISLALAVDSGNISSVLRGWARTDWRDGTNPSDFTMSEPTASGSNLVLHASLGSNHATIPTAVFEAEVFFIVDTDTTLSMYGAEVNAATDPTISRALLMVHEIG